MLYVYPDYYKGFKCIADKCKNSCCIGWEIDIDQNTLDFYRDVGGEMGRRLKKGIVQDENSAHFCLTEDERCPFLNANGLCDIILELGEEHISQICTLHPRFTNELPGRIETGLGLCCEEAARIILSKKIKTKLIKEGIDDTFDETIALRDQAILCLQNRRMTIGNRIKKMLALFSDSVHKFDRIEIIDLLLSLERLNSTWTDMLETAKTAPANTYEFEHHMKNRMHEYEQFLVYIIYRHMANAPDEFELVLRARLTAFVYEIIKMLGAAIFFANGSFEFDDQTELVRLFSSEIEYSDENLDIIYDYLSQI